MVNKNKYYFRLAALPLCAGFQNSCNLAENVFPGRLADKGRLTDTLVCDGSCSSNIVTIKTYGMLLCSRLVCNLFCPAITIKCQKKVT